MFDLDPLLEKLVQLFGFLGVLAILAMAVHIFCDVSLRTALNESIPATEELVTRYYMITLALLPLGWVEWKKQMISVEVANELFAGPWMILSNLFCNLLSAAVYGAFAYATWKKAVEQYDIGSFVMSLNFPMPVWPTYFVLPAAFFVAMLVVLLRIPRDLQRHNS